MQKNNNFNFLNIWGRKNKYHPKNSFNCQIKNMLSRPKWDFQKSHLKLRLTEFDIFKQKIKAETQKVIKVDKRVVEKTSLKLAKIVYLKRIYSYFFFQLFSANQRLFRRRATFPFQPNKKQFSNLRETAVRKRRRQLLYKYYKKIKKKFGLVSLKKFKNIYAVSKPGRYALSKIKFKNFTNNYRFDAHVRRARKRALKKFIKNLKKETKKKNY